MKEDIGQQSQEQLTGFFVKHKDFFVTYAGDSSLRIEMAPPQVSTFAIDLAEGVIYANPKFFESMGYSEAKAFFATLHEFEHFRELKELLDEQGGPKVWKQHSDKIKRHKRLHILDNCFDDIRMNRSVVSRVPTQEAVKNAIYKENLFTDSDMTSSPKHLQFIYTMLREKMLPQEVCIVHPDVRAELNRLGSIKNKGVALLEYASRPDISPALRIELQTKFLEPVYEKFFEQDIEEKKNEKKKNEEKKNEKKKNEEKKNEKKKNEEMKNEEKKKEEGRKEKGEGEGESGDDSNEDQENDGEKSDESNDSKSSSEKQRGDKKTDQKSEDSQEGDGEQNPENYFQEEYEKYFSKNPDRAVSEEEIEKAVEEYLKQKAATGNKDDLAKKIAAAYAQAEGVSESDLQQYQKFWLEVENITNPETEIGVVDELRSLFQRLISERRKSIPRSKQPVEEGDLLVRPAEAVVAVRSGIQEPLVWQTTENKYHVAKHFGSFDITLVLDRSSSMSEGSNDAVKYIEQRKAAALVLEALSEFSSDLDEIRSDLEEDLQVRTEAWGFGDEAQVGILKPLSQTLTEKERVAIYKNLGTVPGNSTKDFLALEQLEKSIPLEDLEKIEAKVLKKIVIVLTDGQSSNPAKANAMAQSLREKGIVVIGVGITNDGSSVLQTYAPEAMVCAKANQLGVVLAKLLEDHLKTL